MTENDTANDAAGGAVGDAANDAVNDTANGVPQDTPQYDTGYTPVDDTTWGRPPDRPAVPLTRVVDGWAVTETSRAFHRSVPRPVRPALRPFADIHLVAYIVLVAVCAVLAAFAILINPVTFGAGPLLLSAGISVVVGAVVWFLLMRLRIAAGTPLLLGAAAIVWGVTAGTMFGSMTVGQAASDVAVQWGAPWLEASFGGAWPEEISKALGVWLLLSVGRAWWNRPWHGIVAGMLVGLGFELYENSLYAVGQAVLDPTSDLSGAVDMWVTRVVAGPGLHIIFAGITGFGVGQALFRAHRSTAWRFGQVLGWGLTGFAVHFLWNMAVPDTVAQIVLLVVVYLAGVGVLVTLIIQSTREMGVAHRAGLAPAVTVYRRLPRVMHELVPSGAVPPPGAASQQVNGVQPASWFPPQQGGVASSSPVQPQGDVPPSAPVQPGTPPPTSGFP